LRHDEPRKPHGRKQRYFQHEAPDVFLGFVKFAGALAGADTVVDRLLDEDALIASRGKQKTGMGERGLRRLFDRLVELGAARELSGRPTFRIYGL
jgi:hypothetical protein